MQPLFSPCANHLYNWPLCHVSSLNDSSWLMKTWCLSYLSSRLISLQPLPSVPSGDQSSSCPRASWVWHKSFRFNLGLSYLSKQTANIWLSKAETKDYKGVPLLFSVPVIDLLWWRHYLMWELREDRVDWWLIETEYRSHFVKRFDVFRYFTELKYFYFLATSHQNSR